MLDIVLAGIAEDEATVETWFFEEGDMVSEGDEIIELSTGGGKFVIQAPSSGLLAEMYYDEGELVAKGEVLCTIDEQEISLGGAEEDE